MSLCDDCIRGVRHEGTAEGKWEEIGGVPSYVSTPAGDYPKDKVILILADAMGPQSINAQLLSDDYAINNNVKVIIPDYYNGDPVPWEAVLPSGNAFHSSFDLMGWLGRHGEAETRPTLDKVLAVLKEQGITSIAAIGYCFGGRYVFDLAFENIISVAVATHPSLLQNPTDFEKYLELAKAPLLINSCTIDSQFGLEFQAKGDEILGDGKFAPGYKREYFDGLIHGFAVRGDMSDPKIKAGKEGAFKASVKWIAEYL
ncbi:dienelactone hydrolase endo-1,3,1,4-beta-D-glucanase [Pluteus cervinus]|uniref:Dienelactone hydrolase endo-1,3,1,4-beta-D-glucanase n=1 Tax=Pluteus cervinus TaxID=181527 RepID=A0ACD3B4S2_9AGAR|nr:dienelactone hydrolase endo-1,3,1,4-beta-D-glucanase [Pluteus cervinus]